MEIFQSITDFNDSDSTIVLTLGMYDGVHLGHQKILNEVVNRAKDRKGKSVLLTFAPHPRKVLQEGVALKMLSLQKEKLDLLEKTGLDYVIVHPFTKEFSRLNSTDFVRNLLVNQIGINELIIGYDHHFGRNREGSFDDLEELSEVYDFDLVKIDAQSFSDITVSSTKIRNALLEGEIEKANQLLNYNYSIEGLVIHGDKIGRTLNFPTANLKVDPEKLIPKKGVYLFQTIYNSKNYYGLVHIGTRPTVEGEEDRIEAFLFDFDQEIYNKKLKISFLQKIREEKKFNSIEELRKQIELDYHKAKNLVNKKP
ncbi:riboflavin kinase [Flavobacteriaceae bacterium UJ101]|nr:riboflavin kinase [Flavobacteriaceae bacterium UJ101]